jgi:HlyD family secretion protein
MMQGILKPTPGWLIGGIVTAMAITGGITLYGIAQLNEAKESAVSFEAVPTVRTLTALGRLEPVIEVIQLAAPISFRWRSPFGAAS